MSGWWRLFIVAVVVWGAAAAWIVLSDRAQNVQSALKLHAESEHVICIDTGPGTRYNLSGPGVDPIYVGRQGEQLTLARLQEARESAVAANDSEAVAALDKDVSDLQGKLRECQQARDSPLFIAPASVFWIEFLIYWLAPLLLVLIVTCTGRWVWRGFKRTQANRRK